MFLSWMELDNEWVRCCTVTSFLEQINIWFNEYTFINNTKHFDSHSSYRRHDNDINRYLGPRVAQWVRSMGLTAHTSLSPIRRGFVASFVNYKKGAFDSQLRVIKFTSCLSRVGGSLTVLRLSPPLKLVAWYRWNIAKSGVKTPKI